MKITYYTNEALVCRVKRRRRTYLSLLIPLVLIALSCFLISGTELFYTTACLSKGQKECSDYTYNSSLSDKRIAAKTERYIEEHSPHFVYPMEGTLTSAFAYRTDPIDGSVNAYHQGIDIAPINDLYIKAYSEGRVTFSSKTDGEYGNYVIISHKEGFETLYAHCSELLVNAGDEVKAGEVIAIVGSTGRSTGTHLHFEVRVEGVPVDPANYLKACGA